MPVRPGLVAIRLLPVLLVALSAMFYVAYVEGTGTYVPRNVLPMFLTIVLATLTLVTGGGTWTGGELPVLSTLILVEE